MSALNDRLDTLTHKLIHQGNTIPTADHGTLGGLTDDDHPQYALDTDLTAHSAAADPHTGYQKESEKGVANGYAGLDAAALVPAAQLGSGTPSAGTVLRGDQTWGAAAGGETDPMVWMGGFV